MKIKINDKEVDGVKKAPEWVANRLDTDAVLYAEEFGKWLAGQAIENGRLHKEQKLTTTQFRNIFSEVVRIRLQGLSENNEKALMLLKPRMAYNMARQKKQGGQALNNVMQPAIDCIFEVEDPKDKQARFDRFADFFEAILAYHRVYDQK